MCLFSCVSLATLGWPRARILTVESDRVLVDDETWLVGQPLVAARQRVVQRDAELLRGVRNRVAQHDVTVDHDAAGPMGTINQTQAWGWRAGLVSGLGSRVRYAPSILADARHCGQQQVGPDASPRLRARQMIIISPTYRMFVTSIRK